jgi:hypothetical protein
VHVFAVEERIALSFITALGSINVTLPAQLARKVGSGLLRVARQGHDHGLASTAHVLGAGSKPLRQGAVLLEHEKSPRQLDHTSSNPKKG